MIKYLKYIPIFFLLALVVCVFSIKEQNLKGVTPQKEFIVAGERVLVGGEQMLGAVGNKFKPEVKLEKWGDETHIRVWSDDAVENKATMKGEKVVSKSKDGKREYNFYEVENGFEYEVILKEKPKTNIIELNIDLKGLECYYQPELTQEEIDDGAFRPENVIGSYACYHKTKKNHIIGQTNYMTGKAFHIYRPQAEDSNGWKVWGELHIENGILTVTLPQEFIDKAVYPIKKASGLTFGYDPESHGGSSYAYFTDRQLGVKVAGAAGIAESISFYLTTSSYDDGPYELAIYKFSDRSKVGVTNSSSGDTPNNYITLDLTTSPEVFAIDYWLIHWGEKFSIAYDSAVSSSKNYAINYPGTWPDTLNVAFETANQSLLFSIYVTYTADTPAEDTKQPLPIIQF